jgi:hypothetical protein
MKFLCPHCQQKIEADAGYAGMELACPTCQGHFIVPGAPAPQPPPQSVVPPPPPPPPTVRQTPTLAASSCPSCGAVLTRGAVLCTQCGYNLATKTRTVAGRPAALGKPSAPSYESKWYASPYPYIGFVLAVLAVLYALGRSNPAMMLAFVGLAALYCLTVHIMAIVAAFRESVGTGFLTLCIPIYALYFVFKVSESDTLKILYGTAIVINILLRFINLSE